MRDRTAVVLGTGGITGIAWHWGVLAGLAHQGVLLSDVDAVIGTSAGAVVGAQLAAGCDVQARFQEQLDRPVDPDAAGISPAAMLRFVGALVSAKDPAAFRVKIGAMALSAETAPEAERKAQVAEWLGGVTAWPETFTATAVNALTGEFVRFHQACGVPLLDAVAASCSAPGLRPTIDIDGHRYYDGGLRSPVNADLAEGYERVVVLAPQSSGGGPIGELRDQVAVLERTSTVVVIKPDDATHAVLGRKPADMVDDSRRKPSAEAGYAQGKAAADDVASALG